MELGQPLAGSTNFSDWIDGRTIPHLSTNSGAASVAFQGWRHFKEAFAPELIQSAFDETSEALGRRVKTIVDPFGGSGTSALASQFLGALPTTIEVNPYLADLIEAKLTSYATDALVDGFNQVMSNSRNVAEIAFEGAPRTFIEPGVKGRYLFSTDVARTLQQLKEGIARLADDRIKRLFLVLLGAVALDVSNVLVSGKGRRYKRGWSVKQSSRDSVRSAFREKVLKAIYDIERFRDRASLDYRVLRGDSRALIKDVGQQDLAIFSPPYPNSFDYTDVYNVELWVCGYLRSPTDNRRLRTATLRSHVQVAREYHVEASPTKTLANTLRQLNDVRAQLWDSAIPDMVAAYFDDMRNVLKELFEQIVPHGRVYVVVGDSQYAGVGIPVATILEEIAHLIGYSTERSASFRSMRSSPQQGGKTSLKETLLVLRR
ncbi:MAG: hypothetical protein EOR68_18510 [Mesorhizobium sp.]|uniref:hypothetical protein n=1 Tax=Mesorhizobium sp. TaxID=1871066 RepID=UPI000FE698D2|nr:hypothetical protein [Mesorhizobium sp.]RWL96715.1 MAG: hypothetical protein EOR68_18510 [Mesorhizobium sp.]TIP00659.1 MAG: hypothetical protein E5X72_29070 [Mesorhizobium sp.]TIP44367.1 MAG: hypothetical protein E5X77_20985 [Mesorhizobium sp.]